MKSSVPESHKPESPEQAGALWALHLLGTLFLAAVLALAAPASAYEGDEAPADREVALWKSCRGVDVGSRLLLTAAHCREVLPDGVIPLVDGRPATPFDYLVVYVPDLTPRSPLSCASGNEGMLLGRRVRIGITRPSGLVELDVRGRPGISGAPIFGSNGGLLSIVVAIDRRDGRVLALIPKVVCSAIMLARRKLIENGDGVP